MKSLVTRTMSAEAGWSTLRLILTLLLTCLALLSCPQQCPQPRPGSLQQDVQRSPEGRPGQVQAGRATPPDSLRSTSEPGVGTRDSQSKGVVPFRFVGVMEGRARHNLEGALASLERAVQAEKLSCLPALLLQGREEFIQALVVPFIQVRDRWGSVCRVGTWHDCDCYRYLSSVL